MHMHASAYICISYRHKFLKVLCYIVIHLFIRFKENLKPPPPRCCVPELFESSMLSISQKDLKKTRKAYPFLEYPQNIANVNLNDHSFINSCKYSTSIANPFYFLYSRGPPPLVNINFRQRIYVYQKKDLGHTPPSPKFFFIETPGINLHPRFPFFRQVNNQ